MKFTPVNLYSPDDASAAMILVAVDGLYIKIPELGAGMVSRASVVEASTIDTFVSKDLQTDIQLLGFWGECSSIVSIVECSSRRRVGFCCCCCCFVSGCDTAKYAGSEPVSL